jgi:di/tricarboxylate transporter
LAEVTRTDGTVVVAPSPDVILTADDTLLFVGVVDSVSELYQFASLRPATGQSTKIPVARHQRRLVEVVVAPTSPLVGQQVRSTCFRETFQAVIIAVCRGGEIVRARIGDITLLGGDLLLLETGPNTSLRHDQHFALVSEVANSTPAHEHWQYMLWGFLLLLGTLVWSQVANVNLMICGAITIIVMVGTGCMTVDQAINAVPARLLVAMAAAFGLASALDKTGASQQIALAIISASEWAGEYGILFAIYLTTALVTQVVTNNAAAALVSRGCKGGRVGELDFLC